MTSHAEHTPPRLVRLLHADPDGIPYFDEELQVPQNTAHRIMVHDLAGIIGTIAKDAGLAFLSDEPIWYLAPEDDQQKTYYGDLVIARPVDTKRIIAEDLLLVIEVVSTNDRRRERKDTRFSPLLNRHNRIPELALLFPDAADGRALTWFKLVDDVYVEQVVTPGGSVTSESVPGLELRVLPQADWTEGQKLEVLYRGDRRCGFAAERERAERERERADQERERAAQEHERAEQERAHAAQERERADRLAARLRELGLDPDEP